MLILSAVTSFCQQTNPSQPLTREDYLKKSKEQKTGAWVLLGIGAASLAIAAPGNVSFGTLGTLTVIGLASAVGCITLFIASGRNKQKALNASAYFKFEKLPSISHAGIAVQSYPAISLKIKENYLAFLTLLCFCNNHLDRLIVIKTGEFKFIFIPL